jgi:ATP-dependent RNA helicase HelY
MEYRGLRLDRFQREAIEYIEQGRSVLVAAPTGTGKTLIADYLIDQVLREGGEAIYTAPVKALSNQKFREYTRLFGAEKVGLITGDLVIHREAPVRIMTTEILRNMLLEGQRASQESGVEVIDEFAPTELLHRGLSRVRAVIVDEIHFLDDQDRGTVWEEMLIYLPPSVRILGLSATLSNLEEFAAWLSEVRQAPVEVVLEKERAVPLEVVLVNRDAGVASPEPFEKAYRRWRKDRTEAAKKDRGQKGGGRRGGGRRGSKGWRGAREGRAKSTSHIEVLESLPRDSFPALYFIYSRRMVEKLAGALSGTDIGRRLNSGGEEKRIEARLSAFEEEHPGVLSKQFSRMLRQGIAFHHAGLHVSLKALVEELYETRQLQVLYCTSTFALGINMPARTVIFDSLTKFNGVDFVPLTIREFMQMAGRAGRRGIDAAGTVAIRQDFEGYDEVRGSLKRLLSGESEPVESSFNLSFHSVVNLLDRFDEETIRTLLDQSFRAFQDDRLIGVLEERVKRAEERSGAAREGPARKERRQVAAMKRELTLLQRPILWENFSRKVTFLKSHGYLADGNELLVPARILRQIKIEEIFVTELVIRGVLEDRSAEEIFGIMVGLVQTLPRQAKVFLPEDQKWFDLFEELRQVYESEIVVGAEELMEQESTFTPELMPLGERWAKGESLSSLLADIRNPTDLAGDLVGGFRRAKDLVSQVRQVHREDAERFRELTEVLKSVTRDEVQVVD